MNFIHKTKKADKKVRHPQDLNSISRARNASRIGGGESTMYENGYAEINWKSKGRK